MCQVLSLLRPNQCYPVCSEASGPNPPLFPLLLLTSVHPSAAVQTSPHRLQNWPNALLFYFIQHLPYHSTCHVVIILPVTYQYASRNNNYHLSSIRVCLKGPLNDGINEAILDRLSGSLFCFLCIPASIAVFGSW